MTIADGNGAAAMSAELAELESIVSSLLGAKTHSEELLVRQVAKYRPVAGPHLSDDDCERLVRRLVKRLNIDVEQGIAIRGKDFEPWLDEKRAALHWERWLTFKQWMLNIKRPWRVVDKMDQLTNEILDFAGDPTVEGPWKRRGLVIGDVQSGKTSTYLALLNKAADAGYRLVIVLAGNTESLRQQTQARIDEGFIGRDSSLNVPRPGSAPSTERFIGVGALRRDLAKATGMSTVMRDFRKSSQEATNISVTSDAADPYVFVLKKNKSVLVALSQWLSQQPLTAGKLDIPLLLLDDESDYASVNTREETNPTAINFAIRNILQWFSRSSYIGFTATPFANIFIDHENTNDLFPRDFIYSLESPSNYVGAEATFGTPDEIDSASVIDLEDADDAFPVGHKVSHEVSVIPDSLRDALRTFVVANAIRDLRGHQDQARAMLVNVSRYKRVQGQVFDLVDEEVSGLRNAIELHSVTYGEGAANPDLDALRETFGTRFPEVEFTWEQVLEALPSAVADIRVQLFNSDKDRKLEETETTWERPQRLIAVGGDVLSRGLTLDGLMTSYFNRNAQASDTLLQMARWFGYRDDYQDLCRLWIDPAVASDYRFVAESVEELRRDLRLMHSQKLTPEYFGLAVRRHPGTLLITAKNKMRAADLRHKTISLMAQRIETTKLSPDDEVIQANYRAFVALIEALQRDVIPHSYTGRGYHKWTAVPKGLISMFLANFESHGTDELFYKSTISNFVGRTPSPLLQSWDVVIVNGKKDKKLTVAGVTFNPPERTITKGSGGELRVSGNSSRLAGSDDLRGLIDPTLAERISAAFKDHSPGKLVPEREFYAHLDRPVLLIYALKPIAATDPRKRADIDSDATLVAVKLAIPGDPLDVENTAADVEYIINTVAQKLWFIEYDSDVSEDEIDD